jgi:hypothetical protein
MERRIWGCATTRVGKMKPMHALSTTQRGNEGFKQTRPRSVGDTVIGISMPSSGELVVLTSLIRIISHIKNDPVLLPPSADRLVPKGYPPRLTEDFSNRRDKLYPSSMSRNATPERSTGLFFTLREIIVNANINLRISLPCPHSSILRFYIKNFLLRSSQATGS